MAEQYLQALGGYENLVDIDACITRLRLEVRDASIIKDSDLKTLGAVGIVRVGENNLQIILGPIAEIIAGEMNKGRPQSLSSNGLMTGSF